MIDKIELGRGQLLQLQDLRIGQVKEFFIRFNIRELK